VLRKEFVVGTRLLLAVCALALLVVAGCKHDHADHDHSRMNAAQAFAAAR